MQGGGRYEEGMEGVRQDIDGVKVRRKEGVAGMEEGGRQEGVKQEKQQQGGIERRERRGRDGRKGKREGERQTQEYVTTS